ncbi:MAG: hypothetical protein GF399_06525 [Candidatus Coatesbacteria bacterium]|nr:hypothetical protein [Candidatus Coatesbacteria bacterium]
MLPWHIWLIVGFVLAMAEILVPGFFLLPFGVAGGITALVSLTGMAVIWQLVIFVVGGALLVFLSRRLFFKDEKRYEEGEAKTNVEALIGRTAVVTRPITDEQHGYVKIGAEEWRAYYPHPGDISFEIGTRLKVTGVDGIKLLVEPLEEAG